MPNYLRAVIDRMEGDFIVLKVSGDQELFWPKKSVDFHCQEGQAVNVILSKEQAESAENDENTKNILRQIFQPNV